MKKKDKKDLIERMVDGAKAYCEMLNETPCIAVGGYSEPEIHLNLIGFTELFSRDEYTVSHFDGSFPFKLKTLMEGMIFFALVSMDDAVKMGLIEFKG
jgi:hypothetical protein